MIQPHQQTDSSNNADRSGLISEHLLSRIIAGNRATHPKRVLVIGQSCEDIGLQLRRQGLVAVTTQTEDLGFTHSLDGVEPASAESEQASSVVESPHGFDLILSFRLYRHEGNLLDASIRSRTARILSHLAPGGEFVVIHPRDQHAAHDAACWMRHLACFPGRIETCDVVQSWLSPVLWRRWWANRRKPGMPQFNRIDSAFALRIPNELISLMEWENHARRGLLTGSDCCNSKSIPMAVAIEERRAA